MAVRYCAIRDSCLIIQAERIWSDTINDVRWVAVHFLIKADLRDQWNVSVVIWSAIGKLCSCYQTNGIVRGLSSEKLNLSTKFEVAS